MTRNSPPTIYDVATVAHVSIATVSRVINNLEKVKPETRSVVLEAIDSLGFVPKADARARAIRTQRRIGVVTPFFTAPSFVQRLRGVAAALGQTPYELVIYTVTSSKHLNSYLDTLPLTGNLDGLIILSLELDDHYVERLLDHHLETVLVEYPHPLLSSVEIDNEEGGKQAADYLHKRGYRRFAFVGDTSTAEYGIHPISLRLNGFRKEISRLGCNLPDCQILIAPYDINKTREQAVEFLKSQELPLAIFAATDLQAISLIQAARQLNLRIPEDLAVLGFDDLDMAEYFNLTTIRQHLDESGEIAVEMLLSRLTNPNRTVQISKLPLEIIERGTT
ncbi:MAG: LacI family transcriptional regulator [Leptolinea sp.]|nr:LacI family transcriptional regulator [Leptolinea sp.]